MDKKSLSAICKNANIERNKAWEILQKKGLIEGRNAVTPAGKIFGIEEAREIDEKTGQPTENTFLVYPTERTLGVLMGEKTPEAPAKLEKREAGTPALTNIKAGPYLVLSISTTGLDPDDEIIELTLLNESGDVVYSSVFRPSADIDPEAAKRNMIKPTELLEAPLFKDEWPKIVEKTRGFRIVGHYLDFSRNMVFQTLQRYSLDANETNQIFEGALDIVTAAKGVLSLTRYSLDSLLDFFGIEKTKPMRTEYKTRLVWQLLLRLDHFTALRFHELSPIFHEKTPQEMTEDERTSIIMQLAGILPRWSGNPMELYWGISYKVQGFTPDDIWKAMNSGNFWEIVNQSRFEHKLNMVGNEK